MCHAAGQGPVESETQVPRSVWFSAQGHREGLAASAQGSCLQREGQLCQEAHTQAGRPTGLLERCRGVWGPGPWGWHGRFRVPAPSRVGGEKHPAWPGPPCGSADVTASPVGRGGGVGLAEEADLTLEITVPRGSTRPGDVRPGRGSGVCTGRSPAHGGVKRKQHGEGVAKPGRDGHRHGGCVGPRRSHSGRSAAAWGPPAPQRLRSALPAVRALLLLAWVRESRAG